MSLNNKKSGVSFISAFISTRGEIAIPSLRRRDVEGLVVVCEFDRWNSVHPPRGRVERRGQREARTDRRRLGSTTVATHAPVLLSSKNLTIEVDSFRAAVSRTVPISTSEMLGVSSWMVLASLSVHSRAITHLSISLSFFLFRQSKIALSSEAYVNCVSFFL